MPIEVMDIDPSQVKDLRPEVLDDKGRLRVLPSSFWEGTTMYQRAALGARTGLYSYPTVELVARLKDIIGGRSAIEIGAGHGVLAEALGIPATDNFQQRMPRYKAIYERAGLVPVPYGPNVIDMHASKAVRFYRPEVVVACWVTHKFDIKQPQRGGNEIGVDEPDILRNCAAYVFVGNGNVHKEKPIWDRKHVIEFPPYVFSRASNGSRDFLAVFKGLKS